MRSSRYTCYSDTGAKGVPLCLLIILTVDWFLWKPLEVATKTTNVVMLRHQYIPSPSKEKPDNPVLMSPSSRNGPHSVTYNRFSPKAFQQSGQERSSAWSNPPYSPSVVTDPWFENAVFDGSRTMRNGDVKMSPSENLSSVRNSVQCKLPESGLINIQAEGNSNILLMPHVADQSTSNPGSRSDLVSRRNHEQTCYGLLSLITVGFPAGIMAVLSLILLIFVNNVYGSVIITERSIMVLRDLCSSFCSVTLVGSICSIMCCFMECYFCLKLMKLRKDATIRIAYYRNESLYLRFFAIGGFFVGVVMFLFAVLMYVHLVGQRQGSTVATTSISVIVSVGILLCLSIFVHGVYSWLCGTLQSTHDGGNADKLVFDKKYSTLV
ncbi:unnamed protein product [Soboliphyme baturini]|uniref:MARVEL domain-containing protein n=1 Tax=Soboliphyme baturini TaxID=241478 RepID=A0A183IUN6_9BILA|nr:unnamed protein product [Soboliphyme baturini]